MLLGTPAFLKKKTSRETSGRGGTEGGNQPPTTPTRRSLHHTNIDQDNRFVIEWIFCFFFSPLWTSVSTVCRIDKLLYIPISQHLYYVSEEVCALRGVTEGTHSCPLISRCFEKSHILFFFSPFFFFPLMNMIFQPKSFSRHLVMD